MIDLDELMRLRVAATPGPWKAEKNHTAYDSWGDSVCYTQQCHNHDNNLAYITAACNAVPELVARIRELEAEIKRRDAQKWADLCNECESDGSCHYVGTCPFEGRKCGDIRTEDWIKWLEGKQ